MQLAGASSASQLQPQTRNGGNVYGAYYTNSTNTMEENNHGPPMEQPTPMYERLVSEEVLEVKAYVRIIENQNRRLAELERVHGDLERRLELASRERLQLESTLEHRERDWANRFKLLEADRKALQIQYNETEATKTYFKDQIEKKDNEIRKMLQRKYDKKGDSPGSLTHSIRSVRPLLNDRQAPQSQLARSTNSGGRDGEHQFLSPYQILADSGSMESIRRRNVENLLSSFFCLDE